MGTSSQDEINLMSDLYLRKRALESASCEIRTKLETGLQELQGEFDARFGKLSDEIEALFQRVSNAPLQIKAPHAHGQRKLFFPQESLLSKMLDYEDEHYKTIFNMFVCVLLLWGLSLAFEDFARDQGSYHFELLTWGLWRDIGSFVRFWLLMFCASFVIVPLAHVAAEARPRSRVVYLSSCATYVALQIGLFMYSTYVVTRSGGLDRAIFAVPLGLGFMLEQCRMSMKAHSYYREKVLWSEFGGNYACAPQSARLVLFETVGLPARDYLSKEMGKFCYFHFAPTLVYRDAYPLTRRIRWFFVLCRGLEFVGIIYYAFCIFREVLPHFEAAAALGRAVSLVDFTRSLFRSMAPAMACMTFCHFLVLHVVQNIGAELTRFADREFYSDWWNSRNFSVFYRSWNGVVHDFVKSYLYMDLVQFCGLSKLAALLTSFLVSALVHEYILSVALGFFLPILGLLFGGPGVLFIILTKNQTGRVWNGFMWLTLATGNAALMVLYTSEYFSRAKGVPAADPLSGRAWAELGMWDALVPRIYRIQVAEQ